MATLTSRIEVYVPDVTAVMVRAKVLGSRFKPSTPGMEAGVVTFKCLELYRGAAPRPGDIFEIQGQRNADAERRPLDAVNQWNGLPFAMNDELLLALHVLPNSKFFAALAAREAPPFRAPTVREGASPGPQGADLKEAVAIEATPVEHRLARIALALRSESDLLRDYAFNALRIPGVASRQQAALALVQAYEATPAGRVRYALLGEMESPSYSNPALGPDSTNRAIVSLWFKAILEEQNAGRRAEFMGQLSAQLGSKASDPVRAKFVEAIQDPPKAKIAELWRSALAGEPGNERYKRLAEAWGR